MNLSEKLEPQPLFRYFEQICQIPRPSKKEEKIRNFLIDFAENHNLSVKTDDAGNVLITKPAFPGRENAPVVVMQTHMDMVCEKNSDKVFDFERDSIIPYVENGWIRAEGTTLGADCGIGMAAQLAVLSSPEIQHGEVECLFTVDEETGLTGAFALKPGFFSGTVLLNLDSEDEGEIFIGCAGGIDTVADFIFQKEEIPSGYRAFKIAVSGLTGGHSGDDIHKNRGNANKILNRFLLGVSGKTGLRLSEFNGGNLRNAIPREAYALFVVPEENVEQLMAEFSGFKGKVTFEYLHAEPGMKMSLDENEIPEFVTDRETQDKLITSVSACPHGVLEMSTRMPGMVETSTNLASVKFLDNQVIRVSTSQRSEIESRKFMAAEMVKSVFYLAGAQVRHSDGYPGWTPDPDSQILKLTVASYAGLFGNEPVVRSIHAGLECGLFLEKYPGLDMVSFGPTIKGAHSPDERLNIDSTGKFWKHLVDVLEKV